MSMHYIADTKGYREFDLINDDGVVVGRLSYESVFSGTARIIINEREVYDIKHRGFWGLSRQVFKSGFPYAEMKPNLRGSVEIFFGNGKILHFRRKNLWYSEFILTYGKEQLLAEVKGEFKWRKFTFNYIIDVHDNMLDREINSLIPFIMAYCAMYQRRRTAAAG